MSFLPVTWWALRCDGDTTRGQCTALLSSIDEESDGCEVLRPVVFETAVIDRDVRQALRVQGWHAARDGRLLCQRHVAALEQLARAAVDGLPFDDHPAADTTAAGRTDHDPSNEHHDPRGDAR